MTSSQSDGALDLTTEGECNLEEVGDFETYRKSIVYGTSENKEVIMVRTSVTLGFEKNYYFGHFQQTVGPS